MTSTTSLSTNFDITLPDVEEVTQILEKIRYDAKVPAIGAVVSVGGKRVSATVGCAMLGNEKPLSIKGRFEVSCIMKLLVSVVTLRLVEQGKIDLESPILTYLPELSTDPSGKGDRILVKHLLSHTSGYLGPDIGEAQVRWGYSWEKFVQFFLQTPQIFPPGSIFNYEHTGFVILGEILLRVTGEGPLSLVTNEIIDPIGISIGGSTTDLPTSDTHVGSHGYRDGYGVGDLVAVRPPPPFSRFWEASLPDMTLALEDFVSIGEALAGSAAGSRRIVRDSIAARLISPLIRAPSVEGMQGSERVPISFGPGCAQPRLTPTLWGNNGSGFGQTAALRFSPQAGIALAVGTNAWIPYARDATVQELFRALTGAEYAKHSAGEELFVRTSILGPYSVKELAGRYIGSFMSEVTASVDEQDLRLDIGAPGKRARYSISVRARGADQCKIDSQQPVSIGFFPHPVSGLPYLHLGVNAYARA